MRAVIYSRVSTNDQTTENQSRELLQVAEKRGWEVINEFSDRGISGSKGRDARPGLNELLNEAANGAFDIVMAWSVDRLGRSLSSLVHSLADLNKAGVQLYLHQQNLDTTTAAGRAMFQMLGVFAEFERELIRSRVKAGMARVKAEGRKPGPKGLEISDPERYETVKQMLLAGKTPWYVHRTTKTGHSTVISIKALLEAQTSS